MAAKKIHASIVTPEQAVFEGDVNFISLPSAEGSLGLLPGHMPIVCQLEIGIIKLSSDSGDHFIAVQRGYMEFFKDNANIITGKAIKTSYQDRHKTLEEISRKHDMV